jgi:tetratricopeptide (TPR) repeat protein
MDEIDDLILNAYETYNAYKLDEAVQKFREIIAIQSQNALAYQGLAMSLDQLKKYNEAIIASEKAIELNPNLAIPHAILGSIYLEWQRFSESEQASRKAIELDPRLANAYVSLGGALASQKAHMQEAETMLRKAIELDPSNSYAFYNLSVLTYNQKRFTESTRLAIRAFALTPSPRNVSMILTALPPRYAWFVVTLIVIAAYFLVQLLSSQ